MAAPDYTNQYNTQLSPYEEQQFYNWAMRMGKIQDLANYDLRGAWKNGLAADPLGHLPDTYKKPNHPTFSNESIYSGPNTPGGEWVQNGDAWTFKASPYNVQVYGTPALQQYFQQVEPDSKLVLPTTQPALTPPSAPASGGLMGSSLFGLGGGVPGALDQGGLAGVLRSLSPDAVTGQIPPPPKKR